jgi:hypothetical protein
VSRAFLLEYQARLIERRDDAFHSFADVLAYDRDHRVAAFLRKARGDGASHDHAFLEEVSLGLVDPDPHVREWAATRAGDLAKGRRRGRPSPVQIARFAQALSWRETEHGAALFLVAAGVGIEHLLAAVERGQTGVAHLLRENALRLGRMPEARAAARARADSAHDETRGLARRILQADPGSPEFDRLRAAARDADPRVRAAAVLDLHRTNDPKALAIVVRLLSEDPDPAVRQNAAMRLGLRADEGVVEALLAAQRVETHAGVRAYIESSLAKLGTGRQGGYP